MTSITTLALGRLLKTSENTRQTEDHGARRAPAKPAVRIMDDRIAVDWPAAVSDETLANLDVWQRTSLLRHAQAMLRLQEAIQTDTPREAKNRRDSVKQLLETGWVEETRLVDVLPSFRMYCIAREARAAFFADFECKLDTNNDGALGVEGDRWLQQVLDFLLAMARAEARVVGFSVDRALEEANRRANLLRTPFRDLPRDSRFAPRRDRQKALRSR